MKSNKENILFLVLTLFFIAFITLISRTPTLTRTMYLVPLWSYLPFLSGRWNHARQILLNIALFIPLGYFLQSMKRTHWTLLIPLILSACIEVTQFFTYRGILDCDDIISNYLGALIGVMICNLIGGKVGIQHCDKARKTISFVMLGMGVIGCLMVAVPTSSNDLSAQVMRQFWFDASTSVVGDELVIEGSCYIYDSATPGYYLILDDQILNTTIDGENYSATTVLPEKKSELQIRFNGYSPMSTGLWIKPDGTIDYVKDSIGKMDGLPTGAILKAYSSDYDTFVFLVPGEDGKEDRIIWLIGWDELDSSTEIIYHLYTNTPELLPDDRIQYRYDNRGFRDGTGYVQQRLGRYRVFEDIIPNNYVVTAIVVGFNTEGTITWSDAFRPIVAL